MLAGVIERSAKYCRATAAFGSLWSNRWYWLVAQAMA